MMVIDLGKLWHKYLKKEVSNAPLIIFRILFGGLMIGSVIRFILKGWVKEFYLQPRFHFTYFGFDWVKPFSEYFVYLLFALLLISAIGIVVGIFYRLSISLFFITFTYVELIDKTYYLNHYYFVSLVSFLLIWLPAHKRFSLDVKLRPHLSTSTCSLLEINMIRWLAGIVYCYAGMAKINVDWLFKAMPLKIWLPANGHLPIIGPFLKLNWVAFAFSWFGALYDLSIPFLLSLQKTRVFAFVTVIFFHLMTAWLFPIGVFPFVMIFTAIIYFPAKTQEQWLSWVEQRLKFKPAFRPSSLPGSLRIALFSIFLLIQLLFPWRYLVYPGSIFWNEEGYRFSWRVMLMEKAGTASFYIADLKNNQRILVDNSAFLTPRQEKMMATQPDMILQYAKYLEKTYQAKGVANPQVTVSSFVTLNGQRSSLFIDPKVDLTQKEESWAHKDWIICHD